MRPLVPLLAVMVAAGTAQASAHDWYEGLRSPTGLRCCDRRDCRLVPYRLNGETGQEEIEANGRWWPVEHDKVLPLTAPDGKAHACWLRRRGRPDFRCIVLPGTADARPPPAVAALSLAGGR
jgi:hypothetical protein